MSIAKKVELLYGAGIVLISISIGINIEIPKALTAADIGCVIRAIIYTVG